MTSDPEAGHSPSCPAIASISDETYGGFGREAVDIADSAAVAQLVSELIAQAPSASANRVAALIHPKRVLIIR